MNRTSSMATLAAWTALVSAALICIVAMLTVDSFRIGQHGMGLLAAKDMPNGAGWRIVGHWWIGILALLPSIQMLVSGEKEGKRALRLAGYFWIIAALAYAMQGFWPLDLENLDSRSNQMHATANSVWWLAATAGAVSWAIARRSTMAVGLASALVVLALIKTFEWMPDGQKALIGWLQLFGWLGTLVQARQRVLE